LSDWGPWPEVSAKLTEISDTAMTNIKNREYHKWTFNLINVIISAETKHFLLKITIVNRGFTESLRMPYSFDFFFLKENLQIYVSVQIFEEWHNMKRHNTTHDYDT
jgi:hypothetical protein